MHYPTPEQEPVIVCKTCGNKNPAPFKFCGECGQSIKTHATSDLIFALKTPERKVVTVLFTDITGYTSISEKLDPEDINQLMAHVFKKISDVVTKYQGTIVKYLGDAAMIVFGSPVSHADDPVRAIKTAREIHQVIQESATPWADKIGRPLSMHTGINTGLVVTETIRKGVIDVTGDTVNTASRLTSVAKDGEIIVGATTFRQANRNFIFKRMKPVKVKGKSHAIEIYKTLFPRKTPEISLKTKMLHASLVGRNQPFHLFKETLEKHIRSKKGAILSVSGDAGIGKSRLLAEVKSYLKDMDLNWLEGKSLPYGHSTSYGPFIEIIKRSADIDPEDTDAIALKKLSKKIILFLPDRHTDILPYIANLLNLEIRGRLLERIKFLDGEAIGHQIFRSVYHFIEKMAQKKPLVLVFEDTHWLDSASLKMICHLLPLVTEVPLIIITVGRNEHASPSKNLTDIIAKTYPGHLTDITLSTLDPEGVRQLIKNLLKIDNIPERLFSIIYRKSEGNPFFVEEILRSLIDKKVIARSKTGNRWQIKTDAEKVEIPGTLRGLITDRIDRLEEDERHILKIASIIGRHFLYSILETICDSDTLDAKIFKLQEIDFIRKNDFATTALEYIFQHALTQEAAYESILKTQRKDLHQKVADAIESIFPDRIEEFYSKLAYHFAHAEDWKKAKDYLFKAGNKAEEIADDREALEHYKKAMIAYEKVFGKKWDPLQRAALERKMGEAFFHHGDHQNAINCFQKALSLLSHPVPSTRWTIRSAIFKQVVVQILHRLFSFVASNLSSDDTDQETQETFRIYEIMGWIDYFMNRERLLLNVITGLNHAERKKSLSGIARGAMGVGLILNTLGMFRMAGFYSEKALQLSKEADNPIILGLGYLGVSVHREFKAAWKEAISLYEHCANAYWQAGDSRKWGNATIWTAFLHNFMSHFKTSMALSKQVYQIGKESGDLLLQGWGLHGMGLNLVYYGNLDQAILTLSSAVQLLKDIPDLYDGAQAYTDLGKCYLYKGDFKKGISVLEETRQMITNHKLNGPMVSLFKNALAKGYLLAWETGTDIAAEPVTAKKVAAALRDALKTNAIFKGGTPQIYRMSGTYYFLKGKEKKAKKWWLKSILCAEKLEATFEKALTHFEIGKRLGDNTHLSEARKRFLEINETNEITQGNSYLYLHEALMKASGAISIYP
ncbi:MAG: AAA family ATPase [Proteobacteria bacterium]|nr:AAA family ATPase [Pseudomonadota bacterium]